MDKVYFKVNIMPEDELIDNGPPAPEVPPMEAPPMEAPPEMGGDPVLEAINALSTQVEQLVALLQGTQGIVDKSKEVPLEGPEGAAATAVEGPSDTEPADESGDTGVPQTTTASTVETDRELNKQKATQMATLQAELDAKNKQLATLQKSISGGNPGATRAPVEDPAGATTGGEKSLEELRMEHIRTLTKGGKVSSKDIFAASGIGEVQS